VRNIEITKDKLINCSQLHAEISAKCPNFVGLSVITADRKIIFHLRDGITNAEIERAKMILKNHKAVKRKKIKEILKEKQTTEEKFDFLAEVLDSRNRDEDTEII